MLTVLSSSAIEPVVVTVGFLRYYDLPGLAGAAGVLARQYIDLSFGKLAVNGVDRNPGCLRKL